MRVILGNRDAAISRGIALLLEKYGQFDVLCEVSKVSHLIPAVAQLRPDATILGPRIPTRNLKRAIGAILRSAPETAVVLLTTQRDTQILREALQAGATAYVSVDTGPEELVQTIELAAKGHYLISADAADSLSELFEHTPMMPSLGDDRPPISTSTFSARELEILELVVNGATNLEIATALFITDNTVKVHLRNIFRKMEVRNRQQAAVRALRMGITGVGHLPVNASSEDDAVQPSAQTA